MGQQFDVIKNQVIWLVCTQNPHRRPAKRSVQWEQLRVQSKKVSLSHKIMQGKATLSRQYISSIYCSLHVLIHWSIITLDVKFTVLNPYDSMLLPHCHMLLLWVLKVRGRFLPFLSTICTKYEVNFKRPHPVWKSYPAWTWWLYDAWCNTSEFHSCALPANPESEKRPNQTTIQTHCSCSPSWFPPSQRTAVPNHLPDFQVLVNNFLQGQVRALANLKHSSFQFALKTANIHICNSWFNHFLQHWKHSVSKKIISRT